MILVVLTTHVFEGPAKGPDKEGNHKDTETQSFFRACPGYARQTKKASFVSLWFNAFLLFATASFAGVTELYPILPMLSDPLMST